MTSRVRVCSHPGVYIKDAIDELGLSQSEFALRTGLSIKNVSTLINGESNITFDVAIKLATFFGNSVEGWINLQTKYNLFLNEKTKLKEYQDDWSIAKEFDKEFVSNVLGFQIDSNNKESTIDQLRKAFNVVTLQSLKHSDMYAFCRTSVIKDMNEKTIVMRNAWISLAEQTARTIKCAATFDKEKIMMNIGYLRSLTLKRAGVINGELKKFLSYCGIKLVILPFLKGSNTSGVTKWINNENCVMVAVNDYGKVADRIWFNIFHEIGHAIKNHKRHMTISYEKNNIQDEEEIEANNFASNALIDSMAYAQFVQKNDFSLKAIQEFSSNQKVADFIIIGRLQKEKLIGWEKYQNRKPEYEIL